MRISDWSSDVCSSDLPGADCIARRSPQYALAAGRTRPEVFRKSDAMGLIDRLLGRSDDRETAALYAAIVARARVPHWYIDGGVPDTVDGRFDMIAAVLAMVLLRLEGDPAGSVPSTHLAERFVDDMDGQLREIGIGDIIVRSEEHPSELQ